MEVSEADVCAYCKEPFSVHDADWPRHRMNPYTEQHMHPMCLMRSVWGSVGHQRGLCSCFGGDVEDPPELTLRQAAMAAFFEHRLTEAALGLTQYCVYFNPLDYPGLYVVREWRILPSNEGGAQPTERVWTAATLEEARGYIPAQCCRMARDEDDEPQIVETWF